MLMAKPAFICVVLSVVELRVVFYISMLKSVDILLLLPCNQLCFENSGMVLSARIITKGPPSI